MFGITNTNALNRLGSKRRRNPNRPPPRKQVTASLADRPRGGGRARGGLGIGKAAMKAARTAKPNQNMSPRNKQFLNKATQMMGFAKGARQMFNEGGMAELDTPIDKLPNPGLKELAKTEKGRKAVKRMGFDHGGLVKGQSCPHREDGVRGTGAALKGGKFSGVF